MLESDLSPFVEVEGFRKEMVMRDFAHMDMLGYGRDFGAALLKSLHLRGELSPTESPLATKLRNIMETLNLDRKAHGKPKLSGSLTCSNCGLDNMSSSSYL